MIQRRWNSSTAVSPVRRHRSSSADNAASTAAQSSDSATSASHLESTASLHAVLPKWSRAATTNSIEHKQFTHMKSQYIKLSQEFHLHESKLSKLQTDLIQTKEELSQAKQREQLQHLSIQQLKGQLDKAKVDTDAKSAALRKLETRLSSTRAGTSLLSRAHVDSLRQSNVFLNAQHEADQQRIQQLQEQLSQYQSQITLLKGAVRVRASQLLHQADDDVRQQQDLQQFIAAQWQQRQEPSQRQNPSSSLESDSFDLTEVDADVADQSLPHPRPFAPPSPHNGGKSPATNSSKHTTPPQSHPNMNSNDETVIHEIFSPEPHDYRHHHTPRAQRSRPITTPSSSSSVDSSAASANSEANVQNAAVSALLLRISSLESTITELRASQATANSTDATTSESSPSALDLARAALNESRRAEQDLQLLIQLKENEIDRLEKDIQAVIKKAAVMENNCSHLNSQNMTLRKQLSDVTSEKQAVLDYCEELRAKMKALSSERDSHRQIRVELQAQLSECYELNKSLLKSSETHEAALAGERRQREATEAAAAEVEQEFQQQLETQSEQLDRIKREFVQRLQKESSRYQHLQLQWRELEAEERMKDEYLIALEKQLDSFMKQQSNTASVAEPRVSNTPQKHTVDASSVRVPSMISQSPSVQPQPEVAAKPAAVPAPSSNVVQSHEPLPIRASVPSLDSLPSHLTAPVDLPSFDAFSSVKSRGTRGNKLPRNSSQPIGVTGSDASPSTPSTVKSESSKAKSPRRSQTAEDFSDDASSTVSTSFSSTLRSVDHRRRSRRRSRSNTRGRSDSRPKSTVHDALSTEYFVLAPSSRSPPRVRRVAKIEQQQADKGKRARSGKSQRSRGSSSSPSRSSSPQSSRSPQVGDRAASSSFRQAPTTSHPPPAASKSQSQHPPTKRRQASESRSKSLKTTSAVIGDPRSRLENPIIEPAATRGNWLTDLGTSSFNWPPNSSAFDYLRHVIAVPSTSEVVFLEKRHWTDSAYELTIVPRESRNPTEFCVMSAEHGFHRYAGGRLIESVSLEQWAHEYANYQRLIRTPFAKHFLLRKYLQLWKRVFPEPKKHNVDVISESMEAAVEKAVEAASNEATKRAATADLKPASSPPVEVPSLLTKLASSNDFLSSFPLSSSSSSNHSMSSISSMSSSLNSQSSTSTSLSSSTNQSQSINVHVSETVHGPRTPQATRRSKSDVDQWTSPDNDDEFTEKHMRATKPRVSAAAASPARAHEMSAVDPTPSSFISSDVTLASIEGGRAAPADEDHLTWSDSSLSSLQQSIEASLIAKAKPITASMMHPRVHMSPSAVATQQAKFFSSSPLISYKDRSLSKHNRAPSITPSLSSFTDSSTNSSIGSDDSSVNEEAATWSDEFEAADETAWYEGMRSGAATVTASTNPASLPNISSIDVDVTLSPTSSPVIVEAQLSPVTTSNANMHGGKRQVQFHGLSPLTPSPASTAEAKPASSFASRILPRPSLAFRSKNATVSEVSASVRASRLQPDSPRSNLRSAAESLRAAREAHLVKSKRRVT